MVLKGNSTAMVAHSNITQTDSGTMFGRQVAAGGDLNGDGYLDMVVSNTGTVDSPTGYSSVEFFMGEETGINSTPVKVHSVLNQGKLYGFEMSIVGDIQGDGFDDLLISELFASTTPTKLERCTCGSEMNQTLSSMMRVQQSKVHSQMLVLVTLFLQQATLTRTVTQISS